MYASVESVLEAPHKLIDRSSFVIDAVIRRCAGLEGRRDVVSTLCRVVVTLVVAVDEVLEEGGHVAFDLAFIAWHTLMMTLPTV